MFTNWTIRHVQLNSLLLQEKDAKVCKKCSKKSTISKSGIHVLYTQKCYDSNKIHNLACQLVTKRQKNCSPHSAKLTQFETIDAQKKYGIKDHENSLVHKFFMKGKKVIQTSKY